MRLLLELLPYHVELFFGDANATISHASLQSYTVLCLLRRQYYDDTSAGRAVLDRITEQMEEDKLVEFPFGKEYTQALTISLDLK